MVDHSNEDFSKQDPIHENIIKESGENCCCVPSGEHPCGVDRRIFLKIAGLGTAAAAAVPKVAAGPFTMPSGKVQHFIPADKKLHPDWVKTLFAKGVPKVYRGKELETIGMPVGGIAAGQLYLGGDGRLLHWDIFNEHIFTGYGRDCYNDEPPASPVDQGFAIRTKVNGKVEVRALDHKGFPNVEFIGEYPIGRVRYRDPSFPVEVTMDAFSPFIPLNTEDSALPITVLKFTLENTSGERVIASLAGWLENAVCLNSGKEMHGYRLNSIQQDHDFSFLECRAKPKSAPASSSPPEVFEDFEGDDYGEWTVEGTAFGAGPVKGTLENQSHVSGYQGEGLINTFLGGDKSEGKLTSPEFTIKRPFINFLIGGGRRRGETGICLLVDGKPVRARTGIHNEKLQWAYWDVRDLKGEKARIQIYDLTGLGWGHINVDQIEFADEPHPLRTGALEEQEDWGTMGLALLGKGRGFLSSAALPDGNAPDVLFTDDGALRQWEGPMEDGASRREFGECHRGALGRNWILGPGYKREMTFLVTWFFPKKVLPGGVDEDTLKGRYYANRFHSAKAVAEYAVENSKRLIGETERWHETYYDSTLPHWLLDRLHSTVSNLATSTAFWFKSGRFWGWEGVGCCAGTCAHVWNYAHAVGRLFPQWERSVREFQDLGAAMDEDGRIRFRGEYNNQYAADGQAGTVLKCYREHLMSKDDSFLKRNWPHIKKALLYLLKQDADDDGLIENSQHNTFDINFFGPNTFVGSLYLGALRAAEEMAKRMGNTAFAQRCRTVFEKGSELSVKRLFNGEYFIQDVDLKEHPDHQYGDGCLADQLFGQGWAVQLGLGDLYPKQYIHSALESIYKYNWAPDVGPQNKVHHPERFFAHPGEAGLFTCVWPKSEHLTAGVRYKNEIWTGIEYQAAGHLLAEGYLEEGLAIIRGIHERYNGIKHNPFNEVECGDHYARALASWGCLIALEGFEYDGPAGYIGFAPRITPESFKGAFTTAEGWGTFEQIRREDKQFETVQIRWGILRVRTLSFELPSNAAASQVSVFVAGRPKNAVVEKEGNRLLIRLSKELIVEQDQEIKIQITS